MSLISLDTRAVVCHGESEIDNAVESAEIRHLKRRYGGTAVQGYEGAAVRVAVRPCYLGEYHLHKTHTLCRIVPGHVFVLELREDRLHRIPSLTLSESEHRITVITIVGSCETLHPKISHCIER